MIIVRGDDGVAQSKKTIEIARGVARLHLGVRSCTSLTWQEHSNAEFL